MMRMMMMTLMMMTMTMTMTMLMLMLMMMMINDVDAAAAADDDDDDDEIKQLFISWGSYLENKEELIISGVQILFSDPNLKVKTQNTMH